MKERSSQGSQSKTRWWQLKYFFRDFHPKIGEDEPILTFAYFSNGLVQPPTTLPQQPRNMKVLGPKYMGP